MAQSVGGSSPQSTEVCGWACHEVASSVMTEEESRTQLLCSLAISQRLVRDFGPTVFQRQPSTDTEPPIGLHLSDA